MMKTERMGLIAVAIMLLALLLVTALRGCTHSPAATSDSADRSVVALPPDTLPTSPQKKKSAHSTKSSTKIDPIQPYPRQHLDEEAR